MIWNLNVIILPYTLSTRYEYAEYFPEHKTDIFTLGE